MLGRININFESIYEARPLNVSLTGNIEDINQKTNSDELAYGAKIAIKWYMFNLDIGYFAEELFIQGGIGLRYNRL